MRPALPPALAAALLLLCSTPALAQATRTWVSGVGDDANPCSRTAPCKTFAGAVAKTAAGGEVATLDPGGFGAVTLTRSMTLDGRGGGSILAGGLSGVVVNAPGATVVLRNLTLTGDGTGTRADGIRVVAAASVQVQDTRISGFSGDGVRFTPAAGGQLLLRGLSSVDNAGAGVRVGASAAGATSSALLERCSLQQGAQGLALEAGGRATAYDVTANDNAGAGVGVSADGAAARAELNVERAQLSGNGVGVEASGTGGASALVRLSRATVSSAGSGAPTRLLGTGSVRSFGNNRLVGGSTPACLPDGVQLEQAALPAAVLDAAYAPLALALRGALGTVSWTLTGALPQGVQFSQGVLSGTPLQGGRYPVTASGTDGNGCTASRSYELQVACPGASLEPASLADATTGTPYPDTALGYAGATAPTTLQLRGALPIGLAFTQGQLRGRPTQPGTFPLELSATDARSCSASRTLTLTVLRSADFQETSAQLRSSASSVAYGAALAFTLEVSGGTGEPTGTVTFFDGERVLGEAPLAARSAQLSAPTLDAGSHSIRAVYGGDARFGGVEAAALEQAVTPAATTTALTLPQSPAAGEPLSLVATVRAAAGIPRGSVRFQDGEQLLGSAPLDAAGTATLALPAGLGAGAHTLLAAYAGEGNHAPSSSPALQQEVLAAEGDGPLPAAGGCGCSQASTPGLLGPALLLALGSLRRRRRRAA